jgi:MerR HTH family regulatory protein
MERLARTVSESSPRPRRNDTRAIERFEPPPDALYTLETTARLVDLSRRAILHYCKHGLISSAVDPIGHGYHFDRGAIRDLRRIEGLRSVCGDDLAGIKIILDLMNEIERLHLKMRSVVQ